MSTKDRILWDISALSTEQIGERHAAKAAAARQREAECLSRGDSACAVLAARVAAHHERLAARFGLLSIKFSRKPR